MRSAFSTVFPHSGSDATAPSPSIWLWGLVLPLILYAARASQVLLDPYLPYDTEHTYLPLARMLLENPGALWSNPLSLKSAPGTYVYMALAGAHVSTIKMLNLVMALSVVVMLFDAARRTAGPIAAAAAAWLLAVSPSLMSLSVYPMVEPPSLFLLTLWLWATAWCMDSKRPFLPVVLAGLALTAATLTRATLMYWIPAIALLSLVALVVPALKAMPIPWKRIAAIHLLALLGVGAYMAKNGAEFNKPAIATGSGAALYFGNLPLTLGEEPPFVGLQHDDGFVTIDATHLSILGDQRLTDTARFIVQQMPLPELASFYLHKAGSILFFSKSDLSSYNDRVWRIGLIVLAAAGLWFGRKRPMVQLTGLLTLYMLAVHVPALYNPRYSIVALDIELTLLAGIGIGLIWQQARRWRVIFSIIVMMITGMLIGAAHQRYSSAIMANFDAQPLRALFLARPESVRTSGFSSDPFKSAATITDNVLKIEWNDEFPETDGFSLLHLNIKELRGECTKAWMTYTNAQGQHREQFMRINSLRNGQDFTRGLLHVFSPGPGKQLTLALQCSKGAQIHLGSMGLYVGAPGLYYRKLQSDR